MITYPLGTVHICDAIRELVRAHNEATADEVKCELLAAINSLCVELGKRANINIWQELPKCEQPM